MVQRSLLGPPISNTKSKSSLIWKAHMPAVSSSVLKGQRLFFYTTVNIPGWFLSWLVVWLPWILFSQYDWGIGTSSQLTNSYFSKGWPNHQPVSLLWGWRDSMYPDLIGARILQGMPPPVALNLHDVSGGRNEAAWKRRLPKHWGSPWQPQKSSQIWFHDICVFLVLKPTLTRA